MVLQRIEKIQKTVDSLLGICTENDAGEVSKEQGNEVLSSEDRTYVRLGTLLLKMHDGVLEKRSIFRTGKWLSSDACALEYYVDFQILTALLQEHFNKKRFKVIKQTITGLGVPNS